MDDRPRLELTGSRLFTAWLAQRQGEPRLHHLPGRQALPDRPQARRPALDLRAQLPALHGARHRPGRHALDVLALPALALRELPRSRRDARTATTRSTCRSPATPPATSTSTTSHADADGRPIFVATRFNCLATIAERASFAPLWRPPFIDRLAAEDRCHLNGLAMRDGRPAYRHLRRRHQRRRGLARAPPRRRRRHRRRERRDRRAPASRCRTRRACTAAGSGWCSRAPASSATSTSPPAASSRSASCRATPAASPSSATTR